jgi:putative nucleotidyltransferase with HDIG domain
MFIRQEDDIPYRQYLESSIDSAYNRNSGKSLEVRAEVIQGFQQAAAEDYMEDPSDRLNYEHVRSSVRRFVSFLESEPAGIKALMELKNTDLSISHHGVNVATLATALAAKVQVGDGTPVTLLALGCLIHDIEHSFNEGLDISTPLASMTPAQLSLYKKHPMAGAMRMQAITFVDQVVVKIISQHEEAMDGSGFPQKLLADQMDPLVLIAATANAYDRLINFEGKAPKDALKHLLIHKMGVYPLPLLQGLQEILKSHQLV